MEQEQPANPSEEVAEKPAKKRRSFLLPVLVVAIAVGGGGYYLYAGSSYEATDNAFLDGRIAQIAPRIAGPIAELNVTDNQLVHAGDVLCTIDPADFTAQLARAQAAYDFAKSSLDGAELQVNLTKVSTTSNLDAVTAAHEAQDAQVDVAKNKIRQFEAQVASAKATLAQQEQLAKAAEGEAARTQADLQRLQSLDKQTVSPQDLDRAKAADTAAQAQLEAAKRRIDSAQAAVKEAEATRSGAREGLRQARSQLDGATAVVEEAKSAPQKVAVSQSQLESARAKLAQCAAELEQARLNLSYTRIVAPADGRVTRRSIERGNYVQPGQALMALVESEVWVVANFKERQIEHIAPGQPVTIRVDAYPSIALRGKVDSFQNGTGARFSLLPPENATGNYVKVVQRIPTKIVLDTPLPDGILLAPGMSVIPKVFVK